MPGRASVFDERPTRKNCRCRAHVKEKRCHRIWAEVMYTRHSGTSEQFELKFPFLHATNGAQQSQWCKRASYGTFECPSGLRRGYVGRVALMAFPIE